MYTTTDIDPDRHGPAGLRTFLNIAMLWNLSTEEQLALLGISDRAVFDEWVVRVRAHEAVSIPMTVIERIGCVLSIYGSLVTLFPEEQTADWLRATNTHPIFDGDSALVTMISGDFNDLRKVVKYLLGQIYR